MSGMIVSGKQPPIGWQLGISRVVAAVAITGMSVGLFWGVYFLITGTIPQMHYPAIAINPLRLVDFQISRWLSDLVGYCFIAAFYQISLLIRQDEVRDNSLWNGIGASILKTPVIFIIGIIIYHLVHSSTFPIRLPELNPVWFWIVWGIIMEIIALLIYRFICMWAADGFSILGLRALHIGVWIWIGLAIGGLPIAIICVIPMLLRLPFTVFKNPESKTI